MNDNVPVIAAIALASVALAVAVIGLLPNLSPRTGDYVECVERCVELFPTESPSRVACIEGCAKVADSEPVVAGEETMP